MTDIVERLRAPAYWFSGSSEGHEGENNAPYEAAARIEQLEAALREIMGMDEVAIVEFKKGDGWLHQRVARAALEERT